MQDVAEALCFLDLVLFEASVGDAQRGEPRVEEVGVPVAVLLEGSWSGVELPAVELDDEVLFFVDGVDLVARDDLVELGEWQVVALEEADEAVLEGGAGGAPFAA